MYDSHIHTKNSADSNQTLDQICTSAIAKGVAGIAICDHVDICFAQKLNTDRAMERCIAEVREARARYGDRIRILQGMELAEAQFDPALTARIVALCDFDVILGSVHTVYLTDVDDSYSRVDWSAKPMARIEAFFDAYLKALRTMVMETDIDVLCHLTCPLRYINGKYARGLKIDAFRPQIDEILSLIIQKEIALEVNTSGVGGQYDDWLPGTEILQRYYEMGGRLLTIGSDAHVPQNIGNAFQKTKEMLKSIGFSDYCYYEKRIPNRRAL